MQRDSARVLRAHVETVAQSELARLQKKVAGVGPAHRAEVERLTRQVIAAIAAKLAAALERSPEPELEALVVRLFGASE